MLKKSDPLPTALMPWRCSVAIKCPEPSSAGSQRAIAVDADVVEGLAFVADPAPVIASSKIFHRIPHFVEKKRAPPSRAAPW
jgi:hypothetical protein